MTVKLKDIARDCGVGITTVSNVLNHRHVNRYSQETRERVLEVARRYHYRPNRMAQSMRAQRTRVVSFVARNIMNGYLHNYHTNPFVVGLSHFLTSQQYHVSLVELAELEPDPNLAADVDHFESMPPLLREQFFDGMVISHGLSERGIEAVADLNLPIVRWDADKLDEFNCIFRDEYEVGRIVTSRLLELGHRRIVFSWNHDDWIAYVAGEPVHFSTRLRYEAYRDTMKTAGLEALHTTSKQTREVAAEIEQSKPTALITLSYGHTIGVLHSLLELGLRVPSDVSLATCDFEKRVGYVGIQPGGMSYDRYAVGKQAGEMLLALIDNPAVPVPSVTVTGEFHVGDTILAA